jgi:hypothetical protein
MIRTRSSGGGGFWFLLAAVCAWSGLGAEAHLHWIAPAAGTVLDVCPDRALDGPSPGTGKCQACAASKLNGGIAPAPAGIALCLPMRSSAAAGAVPQYGGANLSSNGSRAPPTRA